MRTPIGRTIVVVTAAATLAAGGAAYAASGHHAAASHTAVVHAKPATKAVETTSPDTDNVQSGDQTSPDSAAVRAADVTATASGKDVQSGSQAGGPDTTGVTGESSGEGGSGSEVTANDGPGGHADEPANPNADHQFQGQE